MALHQDLIRFTYQGASMRSLFSSGQDIYAKQNYHLNIGKVYVFMYQDEITIHRLIERRDNSLVFKGDFSLSYEEVDPQNVWALVESPFELPFYYCSRLYSRAKPRFFRIIGKLGLMCLSMLVKKPL